MFKLPLTLLTLCMSFLLNAESSDNSLEDVHVDNTHQQTEQNQETKELFNIPGSSSDPMVSIQALPGMHAPAVFMQSPSVRGSSADDNTFYINDTEVEYIFHDLGYSIFSDNLIQRFDIHNAAFPSPFALGTGGQFDVHLREPKQQKFKTIIDAGMLRSGVFIEGSLSENQSILAEFRRSTLGYFAPLLEKAFKTETYPTANDLTIFYNNKINTHNSLSAHFIAYNDEEISDPYYDHNDIKTNSKSLKYSFNQALSWTRVIDKQQHIKSSVSYVKTTELDDRQPYSYLEYSKDKFTIQSQYTINKENFAFKTGINHQFNQFSLQSDSPNDISPCITVQQGCTGVGSTLNGDPVFDENDTVITNTTINDQFNSLEDYLFIENDWFINDLLTLTTGLNFVNNQYLDQNALQPRAKFEYRDFSDLSFFAAFGRHVQSPQTYRLFENTGQPELEFIKSDHFELGVEKSFLNLWSAKSEIYLKNMSNLVNLDDETRYNNTLSGQAYGLELMLKKEKTHKTSGWVAISLSNSTRTDTNTNITTPYYLDIPFAMDVVFDYEVNEKLNIGFRADFRGGELFAKKYLLEQGDNGTAINPDVWETSSQYTERHGLTYNIDLKIDYDTTIKNKQYEFYLDIITYPAEGNDHDVEETTYKITLLPLLGMKMHF